MTMYELADEFHRLILV